MTVFAVLPATPTQAEDASVAEQVSSWVADLFASILASAENSAPQIIPHGQSAADPLSVDEAAPQFWPGGLAAQAPLAVGEESASEIVPNG